MDYKKKYEKYKEKYLALKASQDGQNNGKNVDQDGGQGLPGNAETEKNKQVMLEDLKKAVPDLLKDGNFDFQGILTKILGEGPIETDEHKFIIMYTDGGYSLVGKDKKAADEDHWVIIHNINQ